MISIIYGLWLFLIGNYIGLFMDSLYQLRHFLIALSVCIIVFSFNKKWKNKLSVYMSVSLCILGLWNGVREGPSAAEQLKPYFGKSVIVKGTVEPLSWKEKEGIQSFVLQVAEIESGGAKLEYKKKIRVTISETIKLMDKEVILVGTLEEQRGFRNPGSFDSKTYNRVQEIGGRLSRVKLVKHLSDDSFLTRLSTFNQELRKSMDDCLSIKISHLLGGMLFGGKKIDDEYREIFAENGLSHLFSVSGTHLVLLAGFLSAVLKRMPQGVQRMVIVLCLGMYMLFCGLKAPVLRAFAMTCVILYGGRGAERGRLLCLVAIILLLFKPGWILDIGFQLSFAASAGLVYVLPKIKSRLETFLPEYIAETIGVTLAVQLTTLPIIVNNFHQISLVSFISNLVLLPVLEFASLLAIFGLLFLKVLKIQCILKLSSFFVEQVVLQADFLRKLPCGTICIASLPVWSYVLYYGWLLIWLDKWVIKNLDSKERKIALCSLSVILFLIFIWSNFLPRPFAVYFLDVGQGDCAVVVTPWRKTIVVDTGGLRSFDTGANILVPFLRSLGKKSIDYLVISHYDNDHIGGLKGVLRNVSVKTIIMPRECVTESSKDIYELCKRADSKQILAEEGLQFVIDKTHFDVLGVGDYNVKGNEASTVARISYGGRSILFTGDMDAKREREFWANPKADVLKVAHHGSKSSSTEEFINRVNPKFAVISVGFNNRYGHPNKEVLARLKNADCQILRTDYLGCVQLTLSSGNFTLERWR